MKTQSQKDQAVQRWTSATTLPPQWDPSLQPCCWWWAPQQQWKDSKMVAKPFPEYIYLGFLAPARKCMNGGKKMKVLTQILTVLSPFWKLQEKYWVVCNPQNSNFWVVLWRKWIILDYWGCRGEQNKMDGSLIKKVKRQDFKSTGLKFSRKCLYLISSYRVFSKACPKLV